MKCRECGAAIASWDREAIHDKRAEFGSFMQVMKPGSIWHTCVNGHRVKVEHVEEDPDPLRESLGLEP